MRWDRLRSYDRPGAWLRLVVIRLAVRHRERSGRERLTGTVPDRGVWDPPPVDSRVVSALAALPDPQRDCLVLHHVEDLSVAETASALEMAEGTVRSHLHRGRGALAQLLTDVITEEDRHDRHG
jgi:RNA polymerase sigma-70 factor (ECF subfamily)